MGVKAIVKYLNERKLHTRTGGRWGVGAVHRMLTRPTYIGRHEFNKRSKGKTLKPADQIIAVPVLPLIDQATFDAVQAHLKSRNPKVTPPQVGGGPTMLTGICFCADCGGAMTIRTGYRYYTCSIAARQGATGCQSRSIPMERLDDLVAAHLEERLLDPERLEEVLSVVLDRRQERAERRAADAIELRKKAAEAEVRLKRLYDAIEKGVADIDDESLKERIAELRALKSQAQADAERAVIALESVGAEITPAKLRSFADAARQRLRGPDGRYRRDHLRALAQRVEVAEREVKIMGSRTNLLRTLAAASGVNPATAGVPSFGPKWRRGRDSNPRSPARGTTVFETAPIDRSGTSPALWSPAHNKRRSAIHVEPHTTPSCAARQSRQKPVSRAVIGLPAEGWISGGFGSGCLGRGRGDPSERLHANRRLSATTALAVQSTTGLISRSLGSTSFENRVMFLTASAWVMKPVLPTMIRWPKPPTLS